MVFSGVRSVLSVFLLCTLLTLSSCGENERVAVPADEINLSEDVLKERVAQRWGALVARDFSGAYGYMTPAYRKLHSSNKYVAGFGGSVAWRSIEISAVKVDGARAIIDLVVSYQLSIPDGDAIKLSSEVGMLTKQLQETWLLVDGEWWFFDPVALSDSGV